MAARRQTETNQYGAPRLLGTNEVAELLRVHPKHVYRLLKRGLPAHRMGSEWRFDRDEVLAWARGDDDRGAEGVAPARAEPPPLIAANGDLCVEVILRIAADKFSTVFGFVQADRRTAHALVESGRVIAGGVHGEIEDAEDPVVRIHVVRRVIGLAHAARRKMKKAADVQGQRLASRPTTAGVRSYLDHALERGGVDPAAVHHGATLYASHRDVVLALLTGRADVGLTSVAWAHRAGLHCLPLAEENYTLCMKASALATDAGRALIRTLQSPEAKRQLGETPGYDATDVASLRV